MNFWRKLKATILSRFHAEWGGTLIDYNNGKAIQLMTWSSEDTRELESLLENLLTNGKDGVYLLCVKQERNCGYFIVVDSNKNLWRVSFWAGAYHPADAFLDAANKCREFADALGFVKQEEIVLKTDIEEKP